MTGFNWLLFAALLVMLIAFYYWGKVIGAKQERTRIIDHGYWFQRNQSKISPTMNDFLNAVESGRHWE
jgi:hypothetical protein